MNKLQYHPNKVLKLTNVLKYRILISEDDFNFSIAVEQMQSYIKTKAVMQVGPLIQLTKTFLNDQGELNVEVFILLQCNNFVHGVEQPYSMIPVVRVTDAVYCRYCGPEEKLSFAYQKINVEAFEGDVELSGESYTVFVSRNEDEECIIADVFVPKKQGVLS